MDKPTPPKAMTETESAPGWPAGTKGCLLVTDAQIEAFGEAMAAWGAAQERERIKTLIEQQRGLGYSDDGGNQHLGHDNLVDTLLLLLSAQQGD